MKVAGILQGNSELLGSALNSDIIVEPVRGPLIPGFGEVKKSALHHGEVSVGCIIVVSAIGLKVANQNVIRTEMRLLP